MDKRNQFLRKWALLVFKEEEIKSYLKWNIKKFSIFKRLLMACHQISIIKRKLIKDKSFVFIVVALIMQTNVLNKTLILFHIIN